jgi:hypothetical protein
MAASRIKSRLERSVIEPERTKSTDRVTGVLHINVAYDWGDEIDIRRAAELAPSAEQKLERRSRTPDSIAYRPAPVLFPLDPIMIELGGGDRRQAGVQATVFDFGGMNLRVDLPLTETRDGWQRLANDQSLLTTTIRSVRVAAEPLYQRLLPAITAPDWQDVHEEYLVFHLDPATFSTADATVGESAAWLAGLLRQETGALSEEEISEAMRLRLRYSPHDLAVIDWAGAVVVDSNCEETLQTIEFANLQLLEFRHLDQRLDRSLERVYRLIHSASRGPSERRSPAQSLRAMGNLRIETELMFERASNAFQLVGDQYLARLYRLLVARFHLDQWSQSIRQSLNVAEGVYQVLTEQVSARRIEVMELVVIILIAVEIVLSVWAELL